jgi:hypothetical protein
MIDTGILTEDDPIELLEGWIVAKTPHNPPHNGAIQRSTSGSVGICHPAGTCAFNRLRHRHLLQCGFGPAETTRGDKRDAVPLWNSSGIPCFFLSAARLQHPVHAKRRR